MPFYNYTCPECGKTHERFVTSYKERADVAPCLVCGGSAYYEIAAPHIHWKFTDKEVRIPSNPTSVAVDGFKIVDTPKHIKKQLRNKGKRIPIEKLRKEKEPKPKPS